MGCETEYLILSLKWSDGAAAAVWYAPGACGYTTDLEKAGRFSADEARSHTRGSRGVTAMVRVDDAYLLAERPVIVPANPATIRLLADLA
jgi:hypothetical protein